MRFRPPRLLRRVLAFFTWSARDREMIGRWRFTSSRSRETWSNPGRPKQTPIERRASALAAYDN